MEETNSRLLLIHKYGDICFAPGFKTETGYKLIVSDPENQVKIDGTVGYYTLISTFLSGVVYDKIPEEAKQDASVIFKTVAFNDVTFIEEKDVYRYQFDRFKKYPEPAAFLMTDKEFLVALPIIV